MKKNFTKIILMISTFFVMTENVFGDNIFLTRMVDDSNQFIYRNANGNTENQLSIIIKDDNNVEHIGYCLDVGASLGDRVYIPKLDIGLTEYLNEHFDTETTKKITKKINEYVHFGYKYNGQDNYKYLLATQKLIWDELYNNGYRQNYYSNDAYFYSGKDRIDLTSEINAIKNNINNYYKTPSMCSSTTKLELAVGETMTYEDSANVLSTYEVNCDEGLTCKVEGNKLLVTAINEGSEQKIIFTKNSTNNSSSIIYKNGDQQAVLVNADSLEGISCQMGLDTYKNVQTSGSKNIAAMSIGILSIIIAYIIITRNKYLNAK